MDEARDSTEVAKRLRITFELVDAGIGIKWQNFRRRHPEATEAEIDGLIRNWLRRRPPDGPGRLRPLS